MRNFLAVLLAIIAGLTASLGLVSWKLDGLLHQPEPVQEIIGSGEAADEFKSSVPNALGNMASGSTGVAVFDDAINQAVSAGAGEVAAHEDFEQAWTESLEMTRSGWVDDMNSLRDRMDAGEQIADNATDAQLELRLDPVAQLTVTVFEEAVADATTNLPGAKNSSIDLGLEPELTVNTSIPPVSMLTAEQVVLAEELVTMWPIVLGIAGIVFLMALLIASSGSRWIVWLVTGLVAAITGAASKFGFAQMQNFVLERAADTPHLSMLRPFLRAVQDWADPQLIVLMVAGVGVALLGILGGFIASNRRRSRG